MDIRNSVFITGVTGSLGSWLAREALPHGLSVVALVRGRTDEDARRRVESVFDTIGLGGERRNTTVVRGDLLDDDFETLGQRAAFDRPGAIIHCAACTQFRDNAAAISRRTNVDGTRRVLSLAARLRAPVVYISTAYVAGDRTGLVREDDLFLGQGFNNVYERTKCEAEGLVRKWARETGLPAIILRPGIVVGDSRDGRAVRFNTLYGIMHALDLLTDRLRDEELRVVARAEVTKNVIPVDCFARAAWRIIEHGIPGTYHLTNPSPPSLGELRNIFADLFGAKGIRFVEPGDFARREPTPVERFYRKATGVYAPYLLAEPRFDRTNADAALGQAGIALPPMDRPFFEKLLAYARSVKWGRSRGAAPRPAAPAGSGVEHYFGGFLASKLHQRLLPNLKTLTGSFSIVLKDAPGERWTVALREGAIDSVGRNGPGADCTYEVDAETFAEIVAGRLAPQEAFFARRVEIAGDIEAGMRMAAVLSEFFRTFPFDVSEESR